MKNKLFVVVIAAIILTTIASACWGTAKEDEGYTRPAESVEINQLEVVIESDGRIPGDDIPATECAVLPEPTIEDWWGEEAAYIAKTIYGEAMVCSTTERAAVAWCILNRVDSTDPFYPDDIIGAVTQSQQFHGYDEDHPVLPELYDLALDVIERWLQEKNGAADAGRVLPAEYLFFSGDGTHNYFRTEWRGGTVWDWSLPSPYEE